MRPKNTCPIIHRCGLCLALLFAAAPSRAQEQEIVFAAPEPEAAAPPFDKDNHPLLPQTRKAVERGPTGAFPPPPPEGTARRFHGALSVGPGWLALRDKLGRDGQGATSLTVRVGAVIDPEWSIFLGLEHTTTKRGDATFAQTAASMGVERFFFGRLYLGGALALAMIRESGVPDALTDGPGVGFSALVGIEAWRSRHLALTAEASFTLASYQSEAWEMGGLRMGVALF